MKLLTGYACGNRPDVARRGVLAGDRGCAGNPETLLPRAVRAGFAGWLCLNRSCRHRDVRYRGRVRPGSAEEEYAERVVMGSAAAIEVLDLDVQFFRGPADVQAKPSARYRREGEEQLENYNAPDECPYPHDGAKVR